MASNFQRTTGPSLPRTSRESLEMTCSLNYDVLQSLVDSVVQQLFSTGLNNTHLQSLSNYGSRDFLTGDSCPPILEAGFNVSSTSLSFETYLSFDIKSPGNDALFNSKLVSVYTDLVSGNANLSVLNKEEDPVCNLQLARSIGSDATEWMEEMPLTELPAIVPKSCTTCELKRVQLPVTCATLFFKAIASYSFAVRKFQNEQTSVVKDKITRFSRNLISVIAPTTISGKKSDIDTWREILKMYMDFGILSSSSRDSTGGGGSLNYSQRLTALQNVIVKKRLTRTFRRGESQGLLDELFNISATSLELQEAFDFERQAIVGVLEMFDKKTYMRIRSSFVRFLGLEKTPSDNTQFLHSISSIFSSEVVSIVPQLEDYICIICTDLAFKPIRLRCGHHFCIRCIIRLQRESSEACPMCRQKTVTHADSYSINYDLMRFMETFFPAESKKKQHENERAVATERFIL